MKKAMTRFAVNIKKLRIGYVLMLAIVSTLIIPVLADDTIMVDPRTEIMNITQDTVADQNNIPEPTDTVVAPSETATEVGTVAQTTAQRVTATAPVQTTAKPSPGFEVAIVIVALALIVLKVRR